MAIFKSSLLSDIRGSLNGATFSRTRAGNIIRNRTQPVQPNTPAQTDWRQKFQQAADVFKALSQSEVDEWADAISGSGFTSQNSLGDSYVPSAKQVVTFSTLNFRAVGTLDNPDVSKFLANPNLPDVNWDALLIETLAGTPATLVNFTISVGSSNLNTTAIVAVTPPLLPSIRNYKKYLRQLATGPAGTILVPTPIDLEAAYNAKFPSIDWADQTGNVIGVAVRNVNNDNGLASAWIYCGTLEIPPPDAD